LRKGPIIANLRLKNIYAPGAISYNVYADLPGHEYPNEIVLVGGHFDGHDIAPGAMDDAAGACVILEAARALAMHGVAFKRTIRFCFFAAEELGLVGSTGYVLNRTEEELNQIKLMINTDAVGISAKTGHGFVVCGPEKMTSYLENILDELGTFDRSWELPKVTHDIRSSSDHWPFYMRGIPTAHFRDVPVDPIDQWYSHTSADTVDKVSPKGLKDSALILALVLMQIADDPEIPIKHTPVDQIIAFLEKKEIAENLRLAKRWRREGPAK
jgi:Zn-dependent M28 family amino/carboxypeptidase